MHDIRIDLPPHLDSMRVVKDFIDLISMDFLCMTLTRDINFPIDVE